MRRNNAPCGPRRVTLHAIAAGVPDETRRGIIPARDARARGDVAIMAWLRHSPPDHPVIAAPDIDLTGIEPATEDRILRDAALRDRDHGIWHGRDLRDLAPDALSRWLTDMEYAPPAGESLQQVMARAGQWLDGIPGRLSDDAGMLTLVARPAIIRMLLIHALGGGTTMLHRLDVAPASRSVLSYHGGWRVSLIGGPLPDGMSSSACPASDPPMA